YQDTNKIQADFIDTLAAEHRNVMVVGDDAQSIYSWRGANFKNILAFPERYPDAQVFKIEMNYRSVPEILRVANAAIAANVQQFRKELSATRPTNSVRPAVVGLNDGSEQAQFVAQRILELRDEGIELNKSADNLWRGWESNLNASGEITSWSERLLALPVSAKSKKSWEQLAHTLDEIAPGGQPNPPSEMITSIVEAVYDDYAKANFTDY